ncbi:MAG: MerR family transcriptional regulator [Rhodococcus sp. (in: high G+C Gram-positive bacteria)]
MRISELSARSGVSVASIKYYLREGLLEAGVRTAANQASYGEHHVRRLRLVRSLLDIGGLSIAHVAATLAAVDDDTTSTHGAFEAVMRGLGEPPSSYPSDSYPSDSDPGYSNPGDSDGETAGDAYTEVREWLSDLGWHISPNAPAARRLTELILTLRRFDFPVTPGSFDTAARAAESTAFAEVAYARAMPDRTAAVETMLVGTVVIEQALVEVRRLALEAASARLEEEP